jgi:N-terminal domain of galactosyltransferase
VESWRDRVAARVTYTSQDDAGFRKARAWNLAVRESRSEYLVFIDGDAIPRRGFLSAARRGALPGWMLASKRLNLSPSFSRRVLAERLPVWRWSAGEWLVRAPKELVVASRESTSPGLLLPVRDRRRPWRKNQPEFTPPYEGYGFFMGVWREDLERVNGFDMRFEGWGGEDVDLGLRLRRAGVKCGWAGPRTTMLHLWHQPRKASSTSNTPLVDETRVGTHVEAVEGLRELAAEFGEAQESANRVGSSSPSSEPENV